MSRVGKKPIPLPSGVEATIDGNVVLIKGPLGSLSRTIPAPIRVMSAGGALVVERPSDAREHRALHGLVRSLVANMVEGVTRGFQKGLELSGVGYRATRQGKKLVLTVGYSHPVEIEPPEGIEIDVPTPTVVTVRGIDKEAVGQLAARIRAVRPPEPYKGKGIRYAGERVRRKVGKAGKK